MGEIQRGHLTHKEWICLLHWLPLCWNAEDVKAAISGFGELWDIDPLSDRRNDVFSFRVLIRWHSVLHIPEMLNLMVDERYFRIPIKAESWEEANLIFSVKIQIRTSALPPL